MSYKLFVPSWLTDGQKAVWDRLLDSVKPNASWKQRFDLKLNSPIYEHAILNTRSTLSTTIF